MMVVAVMAVVVVVMTDVGRSAPGRPLECRPVALAEDGMVKKRKGGEEENKEED